MTPEQAQFITSLPLQVILLLALWKVYTDGRNDRAQILDELKSARDENESIKNRLTRIEIHMGIDDPPTLSKRKNVVGDDGAIVSGQA